MKHACLNGIPILFLEWLTWLTNELVVVDNFFYKIHEPVVIILKILSSKIFVKLESKSERFKSTNSQISS